MTACLNTNYDQKYKTLLFMKTCKNDVQKMYKKFFLYLNTFHSYVFKNNKK